jgi:hypothetical protein
LGRQQRAIDRQGKGPDLLLAGEGVKEFAGGPPVLGQSLLVADDDRLPVGGEGRGPRAAVRHLEPRALLAGGGRPEAQRDALLPFTDRQDRLVVGCEGDGGHATGVVEAHRPQPGDRPRRQQVTVEIRAGCFHVGPEAAEVPRPHRARRLHVR